MTSSEKFCLKWNDFQKNVSTSFKDIRNDFCDVTLVGEGGNMIETHKVILAASSNFFKDLLKQTKHPHPLLYMKGINGSHLTSVVDFMYDDEVGIYQEDLDNFLKVDDELQLKGLTGTDKESQEHGHVQEQKHTPYKKQKPNSISLKNNSILEEKYIKGEENESGTTDVIAYNTSEIKTTINNAEIDGAIDSMMKKIDGLWSCSQCRKTDKYKTNMKNHIEGKHTEGVTHPCNHCVKMFRSKNSLAVHISRNHTEL